MIIETNYDKYNECRMEINLYIMKKALLIIGIVLIVIGVLTLLAGALAAFVRVGTLDASADFYEFQNKMMKLHLTTGTITETVGIVLLVLRRKA